MQAQIHAPRTGYAYNLLDNSDFRNPINQRGASTYSGDFTYSIDRWQLGNGGAQIYVISDGLKISNATGAGDYIFQRLERLPPGNYTFAAKFRDNTGAAALTNYSTDQGVTLAPTSYADSGVLVLTFSNGEDLDSTFAYYRLQNTTPGAVCTWEWAALYEGEYTADTLPPYQPKGYAAELAECQRYFESVNSFYFNAQTNSNFNVFILYKANKRISNPTVTVYDQQGNAGKVSEYEDGTWKPVNVTVYSYVNGFRISGIASTGYATISLKAASSADL